MLCVGIGFEKRSTPSLVNLEFVKDARGQIGNEQLPNSGTTQHAHLMNTPVPVVEVADDADAVGVGGPDGEVDTGDTVHGERVRTQLVEDPSVVAFTEQIEVVILNHAAVSIRIVQLDDVSVAVGD